MTAPQHRSFDYFVILAGMRTGSNLLEERLAAYPGVESHGELFNPHFFGQPNETRRFGLSIKARESDPVRVIGAMRSEATGLPGFRLFYDHDRRAIDHVLADPKAAKIILRRRPIDSFISLLVARKTGQWWLGDLTTARSARVAFDAEAYAEFLSTLGAFETRISRALQVTGQTAYHIAYDDLADDDVIGGLARFLGIGTEPDLSKVRAKVQNPSPLAERLTNPAAAQDMIALLAAPDLDAVPHHEPGRGPGIRMFRAGMDLPLLYMPVRGAGIDPVPAWIEANDSGGAPMRGMTQKDLRRWKRQHPGHRSFTVIRHPLARAHDAFCRYILPLDQDAFSDLRDALVRRYDVPLPAAWPDGDWTLDRHRAAFLAFLVFLRGNLGGQTSLRVDNSWATQDTLLSAIAEFVVPDRVLREDRLADGLAALGAEVGRDTVPIAHGFDAPAPFPLSQVASDAIEAACEAAYRRDYMMFGFGRWRQAG